MSLRFGSGWLVIYFLICSCTFICSASQLRARDYTTFNPFEPLPFSVTPDTRGFASLDRRVPHPTFLWSGGSFDLLLSPKVALISPSRQCRRNPFNVGSACAARCSLP